MLTTTLDQPNGGVRDWNFHSWLFLICLGVVWISLNPFYDLSSSNNFDDPSANHEYWTYVVFAALSAACLSAIIRSQRLELKALAVPANMALLAWIGVTLVTSSDVATSLKHGVLVLMSATVAASLYLLPRDNAELARLLIIATGVVIGLSYFGIVVLPQVSIHQAADIGEPQLDGDWRGVFAHKNVASGMFSMLVFVGIYAWRTGRIFAGAGIVSLSALFLINSGGKSSLGLCAVTIFVALCVDLWAKSSWVKAFLLIVPLFLLLTFGVGSTISPEIAAITDNLPVDATFTGRTDIWRFAIEKMWDMPLFGHGLANFWNTDAARFGGQDSTVWAGHAAHAHNAYLDAILDMGFPGLILVLWAFLLQPFFDYLVAAECNDDPATRMLLLMVWMFGVYLSALESIILQRNDPTWVTFLFGTFAFRYMAHRNAKPEHINVVPSA